MFFELIIISFWFEMNIVFPFESFQFQTGHYFVFGVLSVDIEEKPRELIMFVNFPDEGQRFEKLLFVD